MTVIAAALEGLTLGPAQTCLNLTLFPLRRETITPRTYLTLDEALARTGVTVTETSEAGLVPELAFENRLDVPVLLVDGEELVGAKQNRVLNVTVLVPPCAHLKIPVSCVERGRWAWQGREFGTSEQMQYPDARTRRMASVSASMKHSGTHRSDQRAVWDELDRKAASLRVDSATSAMSDLYASRRATLQQYVDAFHTEAEQVGAVFAIAGRVTGLELFDHPDTLRRLLPKFVRAQAMDAIEGTEEAGSAPSAATVEAFVRCVVDANAESFAGVGLGVDVRLEGADAVGAALVEGEAIVHLVAFPVRGRV
jgi:hypothetical protein